MYNIKFNKKINMLQALNDAAEEYIEKRGLLKTTEEEMQAKKQRVDTLLKQLRAELLGE